MTTPLVPRLFPILCANVRHVRHVRQSGAQAIIMNISHFNVSQNEK